MKKYLLFVNNISDIGGAELYILRKSNFIAKKGFEVYIISAKTKDIKFKGLLNYSFLEIKEMLFSPTLFFKKRKEKIINEILDFIDYTEKDEILIESHQVNPALWAEMFAEKVKAKNLVYCIGPFDLQKEIYKNFFNKKLLSNELLGCNESYIPDTFGLIYNNNYFNIPFDRNEIEIVAPHKNKNNNYDLRILTISRIEKRYIKQSILDLINFSKLNSKLRIKYDLILSKDKGKEYDQLAKIVENNKQGNLIINLKGPVTKLTSDLFEGYTLFIGMGTAVLNAVSMGLPSLIVDYRNNKYYGFFGFDYHEFGSGVKIADKSLDYFLYKILDNEVDLEKIKEKGYNFFLENYDSERVNNNFLEYQIKINQNNNKQFFPMKTQINDFKSFVDFIMIHSIGIEGTIVFKKAISKILNKNKNSFR